MKYIDNLNKLKYIAVIAALFATSGAFAQDNTVVSEQCYITKLSGSKIGYDCQNTKSKIDNNVKYYVTTKHSEQELKRFGFSLKMSQDITFIEDSDFKPVFFSAKTQSLGDSSYMEGKFVSPNKISLTTVTNGESKTTDITTDKDILFPMAIDNLYVTEPESVEFSTIDASSDFRIVTITSDKKGKETLEDNGLSGEYTKYASKVDILPSITNYEWRNSSGKMVREKSSLLNLELVAVPKNLVFTENSPIDILSQTLIPIDSDLSTANDMDIVSYKIQTNADNPESTVISDDRQRIMQVKGNTVFIKVKNESSVLNKYKYPISDNSQSEFLKSGPYLILNNDIKTQANALVGGQKDAYKIAKDMEKWVYSNITKKDFSINFANSQEVMKRKQGDCTEHSVLLASLLRAAGIPSKVVVGLMYTNTPQNAFAYHMWVKAYVGKWVSLDPSFPYDNFTPTHIALAETALNTPSDRTDVVLGIAKTLSGLKINVLNFMPTQEALKVDFNNTNGDKVEKIKFSDLLNPNSNAITKIGMNIQNQIEQSNNLTQVQFQTKTKDDYTNDGIYNLSNEKLSAAKDSFEQAAKMIPYNDDFSNIMFAVQLSNMGFYTMAENLLSNLSDDNLWHIQVNNMHSLYFPEKKLTQEQENILITAISKINLQKDYTGAIIYLKKNSVKLKTCEFFYLLNARAYLAAGNTTKALTEINKAIQINPDNAMLKLELSRVYTENKDYSKAQSEIEEIFSMNIKNTKFIDLVNAEYYWLKFKNESKNIPRKQYYLAKSYQAKDDFSAAAEVLNKLIQTGSKKSYVYALLGQLSLSVGQNDDAKKNFKLALQADKNDFDALSGIGKLYKSEGNYSEALSFFQKAERVNSSDKDNLINIAECNSYLGNDKTANKYVNSVLRKDDSNYRANYFRAISYMNSGDLLESQKYLKKSLSVNPLYSAAWIDLAKSEITRGNYFLAKNYLLPVSLIGTNDARYYYFLGLIDKKNEDFASAKMNLTRAVDLKPSFSEALNELNNLEHL